jgi:undecaprenyl-diphosphatase
MWQFVEEIDTALFYLVNSSGRNVFFDFLMPIVSEVKNFYIPMGILWLLLITRKSIKARSVAICILFVIAFSDRVSSDLLKPAFNRPRPYHCLSGVHLYHPNTNTWSVTPQLKEPVRGQSRSFPSSHATNIFAAALLLSYYFRKWWPLFLLMAFTVGYSRVYLGAHFPGDVLVGGMTGLLCALLGIWVNNYVITFFDRRSSA